MESALLSRGFHYGTAPNSVVIGWNSGHAAVTLPDGTPVSSGESGAGVQVGGGGAYQSQFSRHMYLPVQAAAKNTEPAPADPAPVEPAPADPTEPAPAGEPVPVLADPASAPVVPEPEPEPAATSEHPVQVTELPPALPPPAAGVLPEELPPVPAPPVDEAQIGVENVGVPGAIPGAIPA